MGSHLQDDFNSGRKLDEGSVFAVASVCLHDLKDTGGDGESHGYYDGVVLPS